MSAQKKAIIVALAAAMVVGCVLIVRALMSEEEPVTAPKPQETQEETTEEVNGDAVDENSPKVRGSKPLTESIVGNAYQFGELNEGEYGIKYFIDDETMVSVTNGDGGVLTEVNKYKINGEKIIVTTEDGFKYHQKIKEKDGDLVFDDYSVYTLLPSTSESELAGHKYKGAMGILWFLNDNFVLITYKDKSNFYEYSIEGSELTLSQDGIDTLATIEIGKESIKVNGDEYKAVK